MSGSNSSDLDAAARDGAAVHPLGLSVHGLPPVGDAVRASQSTPGARWKLLALLLVCAAPVVASYFTYYVIRPQTHRNFGSLIEPQRPMPALATTDLQGRSSSLVALRNQWLLISIAPAACPADCEQRLYLQRQMRESLGKDKDRVDWVWLVSDGADVPQALRAGVQTATVLRVDPQALSGWLQPEPGHALPEHLYLVDPMGNWMMRFPPNMDAVAAARAKRDLERLLRAAAGWDTAGRPVEP
ncbi:MAG: hypothetical protein M9919_14765 [Burkholderiaceae bacterium]|jgi:hypothetical protein|nr:hypothetical protein [Burkholderiaceae bacterium]MCO5105255.1 hypothetical protein [Burkholderiaceae bacterium]